MIENMLIMAQTAILQTTSVTFNLPTNLVLYLQAFIIALVYGLYGYFSGTGDGLPVQWNTALLVKTVVLALLVAYAEVYLGMTQTAGMTWAQGMLNTFLGILGTDKVTNMVIKNLPQPQAQPPGPGQQ
jgi:hypothetical protein